MSRAVIIQVSLNGIDGGDRPEKPWTPADIAEDGIACIKAGASVIHSHVDRVKVSGEESASRYLEGWEPILAFEPEALLFPTSNWGPDGVANFHHIEPLAKSGALRISFNDVGSPELGHIEDGVLRGARVYDNSADEVAERFELNRRLQLGTSVHVLGLSGLRNVLMWERAGRLPRGCWLNFYFSPEPIDMRYWPNFMVLPARAAMLDLCLELACDAGMPWMASLWGGDLVGSGFGRLVLERGGHLGVGLEPYRGAPTTNATLVREAEQLCCEMGLRVASASEASAMLAVPRPVPIAG